MKYNPYQPNKIIAPGMFVGRLDEIDTIERCLFQAKSGNPQHFLIEGERGIGKSSLLLLISGFSSGHTAAFSHKFNFLTISIDLGGVETQHDIVRSIGRELKSAIAERKALTDRAAKVLDFLSKWEVLGVRYHSSTDLPDPENARDELVNAFSECLNSLGDAIDGIFVMIDEADTPSETAHLGEFVKVFTERLTRKGHNNVILGLAGLPSVITKLRNSHESSPRIFEVLHLDPLEIQERRQVVERGLEYAHEKNDIRTTITDEAMALLCELSEGYPHFIQQFAYSAFASDTDNTIDAADVLDGAYKENGAISQLGKKYFNEMYFERINSHDYRRVLNAMAKYGDGWVSRKALLEESGVKATQINNALNALKTRKIIISDENRQGFYKLPTKSFAAWINAVRSVEERSDTDQTTLFEGGSG